MAGFSQFTRPGGIEKFSFFLKFIGVGFTLLSIFAVVVDFVHDQSSEKVEATVTYINWKNTDNSSDDFGCYLEYELDGEYYYDVRMKEFDSDWREGDVVEVKVNPEHPTSPDLPGYYWWFLGGIPVGVALFLLSFPVKKQALKDDQGIGFPF